MPLTGFGQPPGQTVGTDQAPPAPQPGSSPDPAPVETPDPFHATADESVLRDDGRLFRATPPRTEYEPAPRLTPVRRVLATLLRQRRRLLLSVIAIALGVGYLSGSLSLLQRVSNGLDAQVGSGAEVADLVVEGPIAFDSPLEQVRAQLNDGLRRQLAASPDVAAAEPRLEGNVTILARDGTPLVSAGLTERPIGANWPVDEGLNPYTLAEGRGPTAPDEIAIDTTAAARGGYDVGSQVTVVSSQLRETFRLVGIVRLGETDLPEGSTLALFTLDTTRRVLGQLTDNQAIALRLKPGVDIEEARQRLQPLLGIAEVSDRATYEEHRRLALAKSFTLIRFLLIGFAALTLVVGCFTVANSMALLFDQRRRGFALLRLIGAAPRQIVTAALAEAGLVGMAAAVVGIPFGLAVSWGIERTLGTLGAAVPTSGPIVIWWVIPVSIAIGLLVTVIVSVAPAREASTTSPLGAVTGALDAPVAARRPGRWLIRFALAAAVGAVAGWLAATSPIAMAIGAAAALAIAGAATALPLVLRGLVGIVTRVAIGSSAAMRALSAQRSRQARTRVAATSAALMFAAFVVSGLAVLSSSLVASLDGQVARAVTADLVVDSGTFTRGSLPVELLDELADDPQVAAVSGFRYAQLTVGRSSVRAIGVTGSTVGEVIDLHPTSGDLTKLAPTSIALADDVARTEGLSVGSRVFVRFGPNGTEPLTVSAIYPSTISFVGGAIVNRDVLARQVPASVDILALVKLAAGGDPTHIVDVARQFGVGTVLPPSEFIANRADLLRGFVRVVQWMLLFSVLLATIGVANTLQLSVNERRRELGLLRAVGASRRQVLRLVVSEAIGLSVIGTVLGIAAGVGAAFAAQRALTSLGLTTFEAPLLTVLVVAVAALALGLGASVLPGLRASQVEPLEAVATADEASMGGARRRRNARARSGISSPSLGTSARRRGLHRRRTGETDATEGVSESEMATRCFNCGNDPGSGELCQHCGESQIAEPLGMFSTRPTLVAPKSNETSAVNGNGDGHGDGRGDRRGDGTTIVGEAPSAATARNDSVPRSNLWSVGTDEPDATTSIDAPPPAFFSEQRRGNIVDAAIVDDPDEDAPRVDVRTAPPSARMAAPPPSVGSTPPPPTPGQRTTRAADRAQPDLRGTNRRPPAPDWGDPPPTQLRSPFATPDDDRDLDVEVTAPPSPFGTDDPEDRWADTPATPISTGEPDPDVVAPAGPATPQGYRPVGAAEAAAHAAQVAVGPATAPGQPYPGAFPPPGTPFPQPTYQQPTYEQPVYQPPAYPQAPTYPQAPAYAQPAWVQPTYAAPPAAITAAPAPSPSGPAPVAMPDVHGVAAAMSRLSPRSHQLGILPVTVAAGLLGTDEVAISIVVGTSGGVPAAVTLTSSRVIVVIDRRWVPAVEVFQLRAGLAVQGRHLGEAASISIGEGQRGVTVDDIADVAVAVEMATMIRSRCTTPTGF